VLDDPMILLDHVVQILHLTQFNRCAGIGLNTLDGSGVGTTLVNGDLVGQAVLTDGAFQEAARCGQIAFGREQKVDSGAVTVDGAIEVLPLAADQHIGLIHPPTVADRALAATEGRGKYRQDFERPAVNGRVIDGYAARALSPQCAAGSVEKRRTTARMSA
jgi:hypothetical protein